MPSEIERKFIVPLAHHHLFLGREGGTEMVQAYLSTNPDCTVRLRVTKTGNEELAKVTIKGRPTDGGMVRSEWEWPVPVGDAREVIARLNPPSLHKTRHVVTHGDDTWEVDVLRVGGQHLVVAEYEAPTLAQVQNVTLPPWVGRDVTGDATFIMSTLTTEAMRDLAWRKAYL